MSIIKTWISALRLRTLPLAVSGILMGTYLADVYYSASATVLWLALATAVSLQILSNLANDYGDFTKGTDNEKRLGNLRALQSRNITPGQMLRVIILFVILSLIFGIWLLLEATHGNINYAFVIFFILGIAAIVAAIKYTMGKNPYGYSGWGDVFVFIFFGVVAVLGTFLLQTGFEFNWQQDWAVLLATLAIGLLSTGVLNTNNIRDIENDAASGKRTIPVKIGLRNARVYHFILIITACISICIFLVVAPVAPISWLTLFAFTPLIKQTIRVYKTSPSPAFNPLLKQLSLGTLVLVLLLIITEIAGSIIQVLNITKAFER